LVRHILDASWFLDGLGGHLAEQVDALILLSGLNGHVNNKNDHGDGLL
jgi:hypothetical protein